MNAKLITQAALWVALKVPLMIATAKLWLFNIAAKANPIGLIVVAIGALIGGLIAAYKRFDRFRAIILGTWEVIKGFGGMLKEFVIDRIRSIISGLGRMGNAIGKLFRGNFRGAFTEAKQGVRDLSGFDVKKQAAINTINLRHDFSDKYREVLADAAKAREKEANQPSDTEPGGDFAGVPFNDSPVSGVPAFAPSQPGDDARAIRGGSQTRNITINIETLSNIEQYSPQAAEINNMNPSQFEQYITEVLIRGVRGAEKAL